MTRLIRQAFTAALFILTPSWVFCQETPPKALPASGPPAARLPYQYLSQAGHVTSSVPLGEAPPEGEAHLNRAQQGLPGTKIHRIGRAAAMAYDVPPIVMQFSTVGDSTDSLRADLSALTALVRKALEEKEDEETLTAPDAHFGHGPNNTSVRAMHVEGFGPLVFVKVKFPLLNVSGSVQEASEATTGAQFNRAKQALPRAAEQPFPADMAVGPLYDANQVEALENQVLGSLKEAKSLQSFKAEEFLSVVVFGPPGGTGSGVSTAQRRGTVLAIRVKKSDIDKFAAGKLDASKFKERAVIAAYFGSGYDVTSVNSWVRSGSSMQLQPEDFGQGLQGAK